ncbi:hypothetical protein GZ77_23210 [Endozoicomonas montiporae]|uniref:Uncharacterized protein n=1 Tax=Endozoicomonas montiporae TaxID=1027273 RepID=A0A081N0M9_9GAMM|nr:hypothetical protein GZ77_23210 [Endozoicomonas montiporae]
MLDKILAGRITQGFSNDLSIKLVRCTILYAKFGSADDLKDSPSFSSFLIVVVALATYLHPIGQDT